MSDGTSSSTTAVTIFGTHNAKPVHRITFEAPSGKLRCSVITFGATLQSFQMKQDKPMTGKFTELTLGFDDLQSYLDKPGHLGATVGRFANRIGNAAFPGSAVFHPDGDKKQFKLPANNNDKHTLHGGPGGFSRRVWDSFELIESAKKKNSHDEGESQERAVIGVTLKIHSPDGDEGFPGDLTAAVTYRFCEEDEKGDSSFLMEFAASVEKCPTVCSLTNHAYWNLADRGPDGVPSVLAHKLHIPNGQFYVATDAYSIPTGEIKKTKGTALDFTAEGKLLAADIDDPLINPGPPARGGYDNCLLLQGGPPTAMRHAATVTEPNSGRAMKVETTFPATQVYSGNYLASGTVGLGGVRFGPRTGLCLECQLLPDSPNYSHFPSTALVPGQRWHYQTRHSFSNVPSSG